jgi:hypothetical protein
MLPDLISFNNIKNEEQINEKEIDEDNYVIQPNDLSKYIFRQRTQELLFISNNFLDKDSSEINNSLLVERKKQNQSIIEVIVQFSIFTFYKQIKLL